MMKAYRFLLFSLLFLLLSVLAGMFYFYQSTEELYYLVAVLWILTVIILLWYGNRFIFQLLDTRVSWLTHTTRRFFLQILFSCAYSLLCINFTYYLFKIQTTLSAPDITQMVVLNVYGLLFIIPVLAVNFSIYFIMQWKMAHQQSDKLREENLRTQLNSLRMQLDPHFLFNNLNVLSSLIEKDSQTAQSFLDKFADVYRYVLEYKKEELVSVKTELDFIDSYVYLLKKRFGKQLHIEISVSDARSEVWHIPPLSLQLLIENALKHNKISEESPLLIEVFTQDHKWLVVRNRYQPRLSGNLKSSHTGLENIRRRYEYVSEETIEIDQSDAYFTVRLPLLEVDI